jgi:hypothetical protein
MVSVLPLTLREPLPARVTVESFAICSAASSQTTPPLTVRLPATAVALPVFWRASMPALTIVSPV